MLIEFKCKNYRSFLDEAILSLEKENCSYKNGVLADESNKLLSAAAIYGKNGAGKSNLIHAFHIAVLFICNASRLQHESASIPVEPFMLNDFSQYEPTSFEFVYTCQGQNYLYGFSATQEKIQEEHLYSVTKEKKTMIFKRDEQKFTFAKEKAKRKLIAQTVSKNQLFLSNAGALNDTQCKEAMYWFRNQVFFLQDCPDYFSLPYDSNLNVLPRSWSDFITSADFGIEKIQLETNGKTIEESLYSALDEVPESLQKSVLEFVNLLLDDSALAQRQLQNAQLQTTFWHRGKDHNGQMQLYPLKISHESSGTKRWIALMSYISTTLEKGGILFADLIEKDLHPLLADALISKFQSRKSNPNGAQLIFTTHNTNFLEMDLLQSNQIYFVDKNKDGASFLNRNLELEKKQSFRKDYLSGKYGAIPILEIENIEA
jgi:AAA15 family ATPase/GTPase